MIVFFYDKTFEGFLTAVFDAYSRKTFPDRLLGEGSITPMFMEESYTVITQEDRSARVWASLQKKLSKTACNMLNYVWLSEEEGCEDLLFRYVRKVFDNAHSIKWIITPLSSEATKAHEIYRLYNHGSNCPYPEYQIEFERGATFVITAIENGDNFKTIHMGV